MECESASKASEEASCQSTDETGANASGSLFREGSYRWWFCADSASATALALKSLAVSLLGFSLSRSLVAAGSLTTLMLIVQQCGAFFGGVVIDRHNRTVLVVINSVVGLLGWGGIAILDAEGKLSFAVFTLTICTVSGVNGLLGKTTDAMLRSIVPVRRYAQARSINEGRDATIGMIGAPLSGMLYALAPWIPFAAMSLLYAVGGATILPAGRTCAHDAEQLNRRAHGFWSDLRDGLVWVLRRKTLLFLMGIACLMNFAASGMQYAIQLQLVNEGVSSVLIGYIDVGVGIGLLLGSLIATRVSDSAKVGHTLIATLLCYIACALPMTWSDSYWLLLVCAAFAFMGFPLFNAVTMGFIFAKTPVGLQGRVSTTIGIPAQLLSVLTSSIAGMTIISWGFSRTMIVYVGAAFVALMVALTVGCVRSIPASKNWGSTQL